MPQSRPVRPRVVSAEPPEVVDPRWLLKAAGAVILLGLACAYLTLCLYFYKGQDQLILHASRTAAATPASQQLAFQSVRFGDDASGHPQLSAWWIPSDLPTDPTVLMLHGEDGSMSDALPYAKALHAARLNVLLFDYRGYGNSAGRHASQRTMQQDARSALEYLTSSRHIPEGSVVVYGSHLGASLAATLCADNNKLPALILVDADGDTLSRVEADQRSRIVPVGLLFHERFPLADTLHTLRTPKLLISYTRGEAPEIAQRAADPKTTAEIPQSDGPGEITAIVRRFLGTYIAHPVPVLQPSH